MSKKKQTVAQKTVGMATSFLPKPLADFFSTRWGSRVFLLLVPFLLASGVLTVSWNNGIPSVSFDRARALVVGQQVSQHVESEALRAAQEYQGQQPGQPQQQQPVSLQQQQQSWQQSPQQYQQPQSQYQPQYQTQPQPQYQPQYQGYPQPTPQQATQPVGPRAYR